MNKSLLWAFTLVGCLCSCSGSQTAEATRKIEPVAEKNSSSVKVPLFNQDSAFSYIERQCAFGPRVPNTKAHENCLQYLETEMKRFGASVSLQKADLKAFNGTVLKSTNVISSFFPDRNKRVVLFAHWDCRPFSDADKSGVSNIPVMGANDGASGVAVLMEVARNLVAADPGIGVDIVFFDSEDYGAPHDVESKVQDDWCLGSQYWSKNTGYTAANKPFVGVLLDMVGASQPQFCIDAISNYFAPSFATAFWKQASELGFGGMFLNRVGAQIIDDHYYVNSLAGIPTFDIIDYRAGEGFPEMWHTQHDDVAHIDKTTLAAVGRVLLRFIYNNCAQR